jgi:hypothetical protein
VYKPTADTGSLHFGLSRLHDDILTADNIINVTVASVEAVLKKLFPGLSAVEAIDKLHRRLASSY